MVVLTPTYTTFSRSFAKRNHTIRCGFFLFSLLRLQQGFYDYQIVALPTERAKSVVCCRPPPVADEGRRAEVPRSTEARVRNGAREYVGNRKRRQSQTLIIFRSAVSLNTGSSPVGGAKRKSVHESGRIFVCIIHFSIFIIHYSLTGNGFSNE